MEKQKTDYLEKLKGIRKDQWLVVFLAGILAAVIALPIKGDEKSSPDTIFLENSTEETRLRKEDSAQTIAELEARLEEILSQMDGAGQVRVMISGRDNGEKIVEKDAPLQQSNVQEEGEGSARTSSDETKEETTVYVRDADGGETPYVRQELSPNITGVLVLAEGGDNAVVEKNITDAVKALFGLEAHKIKVMKMQERRG
ncbi:MAG: stage III sporulation protein AG [Marvinbryantia sp.]